MRLTIRIIMLAALPLLTAGLSSVEAQTKKPGGGPSPAQTNPAIAFITAQNNGRQDVVVAAANLGSEIVLTNSLQLTERNSRRLFGSPAWSPDGVSVAFWAQNVVNGVHSQMKLYVARADGSGVTLIRDFTTRPGKGPGFNSSGINWSPSGKELVYSRPSTGELISIDIETGNTRVLLDAFYSGDPIRHPALSPDLDLVTLGYQGSLAVTGLDNSVGDNGTLHSDVYIVPIDDDANGYLLPIDSTQFVNVTNTPGTSQFHPSWSPDGTELAIFNNEQLSVINMTTGVVRTLPGGFFTHVDAEERATWTSDHQHLVYKSPVVGNSDLAIIQADGSAAPQRYTQTNRLEWAPAWNPRWNPSGPGGF